jgi:hypothetical protein
MLSHQRTQQQVPAERPSFIRTFLRSITITISGFIATIILFLEESGDFLSLLHWSAFIAYLGLPILGFSNFIATRFRGLGKWVGVGFGIMGTIIFILGVIFWFIAYS